MKSKSEIAEGLRNRYFMAGIGLLTVILVGGIYYVGTARWEEAVIVLACFTTAALACSAFFLSALADAMIDDAKKGGK